ncbi:MAG: hypothetical protein KME07_02020 [Pegethrix bostrychoides GSE-TBD4-15B]|uniref:Polysaccharide biosynthesis enzyme WcbI domain-containing protein n=1 Tax=Pegethrix bostrychoides GSE-TBD4-15B TaxID=2839662 RepID=A0A951P761_9CYAN|nr:hypothetical protein [Pegethrix bostrychoides GSE-TBD4-15B]
MKFFVIANCQQSPLVSILRYNGIDIESFSKPIHLVNRDDAEEIRRRAASSDAVIIQYNQSSMLTELELDPASIQASCQRVCVIPNIYTGINHPTFITFSSMLSSLSDEGKNLIKRLAVGLYYDCLPHAALSLDIPLHELTGVIENTTLSSPSLILEYLSELRTREKNCNVKISDYLESNACKSYLFYSLNHPVNDVLRELCSRILNYYELSNDLKIRVKPYLSNYRLPIYPFVSKALGLSGKPNWPFGGDENDHEMRLECGQFDHFERYTTVAGRSEWNELRERVESNGVYHKTIQILHEVF